MAQSVIITLTDDIDGGEASETVAFALDGRAYEIDLNKKNAAALRRVLDPYIQKGRSSKSAGGGRGARRSGGVKTLFSQLDSEEKDRFRKWSKMPNARRIADARVQDWVNAGRP